MLSDEHQLELGELLMAVDAWAARQEAAGKRVDRSLAFASESMQYALRSDPDQQDPDLMRVFDAAAHYVETYRSVLREPS